MKPLPFEIPELKAELERSLGFALRPLARLGGSAAFNFKAVRARDGMPFAVKCLPQASQTSYERIVAHLADLAEVNAVRRVFEKECVPTFRDCHVVCTTWCDGDHLFPDRLTDEEFATFLDDYFSFSAAMQKVKTLSEPRPVLEWREEVLSKCRGLAGCLLRKEIERIPLEDCIYRPDIMRVTHSDFHHGNIVFANGRIRGVLDLEGLRPGYPADDLVRYFTCAAEHLKLHSHFRRRRMLRLFRLAVRRMPYSRHEWMTAINARFLLKCSRRLHGSNCVGMAKAFNLAWRARFYHDLRMEAEEALKP